MNRKKLTTYDYLACKGKRQLSNLFVHSEDEAAAAEEAGIDFIVAAHDLPQFGIKTTFDEVKRIRKAAPSCYMQAAKKKGGKVNYDMFNTFPIRFF